jgi:hypothetical protein
MASRKISAAPRVFTVESTARALRREIARHNLRVALIALFTLVVAAGLWIVLYAVCAWVLMLAFVAVGVSRTALPHGFTILFLVTAACWVAYAWVDRHFTFNALPRDDKTGREIAADLLLALPRITLSVPGTLSAALSLRAEECAEAAAFLHRLAHERRIPLHSVPLDIVDAQARFRILFALQLLEVIDLRRDANELSIRLNSSRPRTLGLSA